MNDLLEQLEENMVSEVKEVTEQIMNNMAAQTAAEARKHAIFYFYKKGKVNIHYKAISTLSIFKDSMQFYSVFNPGRDLVDSLQMSKLPALLGVAPPPEENPE